MTGARPKALWAELRRGSTFLLVPERAWLSVQWSHRRAAIDEPVWDEGTGAWLVSAAAADVLSVAAQTLPVSDLLRTFAHFEGTFVSGTTSASALTTEAATQPREDLVAFLRLGSFSWRFIDA